MERPGEANSCSPRLSQTGTNGRTGATIIEETRVLADVLRARAEETERARRLAPDLIEALSEAGVWRMFIPKELGGSELDPITGVGVIEALAAGDGAAGWCAMIGAGNTILVAYLTEDAARAVMADGPDRPTGGVFMPLGVAHEVNGGYRVSGRWPFASGCEHCDWLCGSSIITDHGGPRRLRNGVPDAPIMFFPATEVRVIDTWDACGLRGTGSHDIEVDDIFVPSGFVARFVGPRWPAGLLYRLPFKAVGGPLFAAVPIGIARGALDELIALAEGKTRWQTNGSLANSPAFQAQVARAEGELRSARSFLYETTEQTWSEALVTGEVSARQGALMRLATVHATHAAANVVDAAYHAAGVASVYATSPLQRCFRDVHMVTQHVMANPAVLEPIGQVLLGQDAASFMLTGPRIEEEVGGKPRREDRALPSSP